jgi:C4-dicarboxylate transporter DctM subunit
MGALLLIMTMSFALNKFLVEQKVPDIAAAWIAHQEMSPFAFVLAINVLLLIVGCLMDSISALLVIAPLLVPIGHALGIDLVHLGMIFIINLEIGYLTPPIGLNLFVASTVFKRPLSAVIRGAIPFIGIMLVGLVCISYVPSISLGPVNVVLRDKPFYVAFPSGAPEATPTPDQMAGTPTPVPSATGRVLTIQEMMAERKKREQEAAAGGSPTPEGSPTATPEAAASPASTRVLTIQEMMAARKKREAEAAASPTTTPQSP